MSNNETGERGKKLNIYSFLFRASISTLHFLAIHIYFFCVLLFLFPIFNNRNDKKNENVRNVYLKLDTTNAGESSASAVTSACSPSLGIYGNLVTLVFALFLLIET